ncbi:MAG: ribose-5-phosphate isomerase RpiA [Thermoproteota archaeon]
MKVREELKAAACRSALKHISSGQVIGLGSGSTMAIFISLLGEVVRSKRIDLKVIPTSHQAHYLAIENGLQIATLDEYPSPDLAVDGADQIDLKLNMIKGGGGALAREKIIDTSSKFVVIVVDESKLVDSIGIGFSVPIEIIPIATKPLLRRIDAMGGRGSLRIGDRKVGPVVTDNGNFILDVDFGGIRDPEKLEKELKLLPGVVEVGIFCNIADLAYVAGKEGVKTLST